MLNVIEFRYSSIPLRCLPTYLDSIYPTYSFHTSQKPFLFDSSLTSHLPFQSSVGHAPRERRRFQSWGQHNNCISPFFTSREPDPARTLCCQGKKQTEPNPPSVDPVFTPFPPFRPNRREKQPGVGFFSSLKSIICISRTARNFLRITEGPFSIEFINPFERNPLFDPLYTYIYIYFYRICRILLIVIINYQEGNWSNWIN